MIRNAANPQPDHPYRSTDPSASAGCAPCMVSLSNHHDEVKGGEWGYKKLTKKGRFYTVIPL
ncbi:MAG: hypothetical protein E3K29_08080 [Candidatus Brocadia sp.]|nr:hypothetical protein [Candidatus Brocadia sp.]